jgi:hypothetical protein
MTYVAAIMSFRLLTPQGVTIEVDTPAEVSALLQELEQSGPDLAIPARGTTGPMTEEHPERPDTPKAATEEDRNLLKRLTNRGQKGVLSRDVSRVLGAQKKGIPGALSRWAQAVGLAAEGEALKRILENGRFENDRMWKLTPEGLRRARRLIVHT